jgi:hypothetical protein
MLVFKPYIPSLSYASSFQFIFTSYPFINAKAVPLHTMKALGGKEYSSYSFLTLALDGGEWSASRPGRALVPGKGPPVPIVQQAGWAPEPVWTQTRGKILSPLPGIEPRSPDRPARSQTLYWLSYPAHPTLSYDAILQGWPQCCTLAACGARKVPLIMLGFEKQSILCDLSPQIQTLLPTLY